MTFDIETELKKLPEKPGVYLMHDRYDHIIYVGKAIVLKNRVRQYFQKGYKRSPKIERMVSQIAWFEYIVTDSETEALVLECNLIKEHHPKYNTMLTDDKGYPFVKITVNEPFPRILFARKVQHDKGRYFGPFTNVGAIRDSIKLVQKLYQIRSCNRVLPRDIGKERPCLNHHIGLCQAPCAGLVSRSDYQEQIRKAVDFLSGNYGPVGDEVERKMKAAAEAMEFEEAAALRELLFSIRHMDECQKMTDTAGDNRDILALAMDGADAIMQVFFVRDGKVIGREHFHVRVAEGDEQPAIVSEFLKQFYSGTPFIPKEIFLPVMPEEADLIRRWLELRAGHKVGLVVPKRGEKHKLVELAEQNAGIVLTRDKDRVKREELKTVGALNRLKELLGLPVLHRMEAYDISNTSGFQSVGSMVVFEEGRPKKNDYRKFKIRTVVGPDDYASMEEMLMRRFSHGLAETEMLRERGMEETYGSFSSFPDLILMDGGRGQVHVAESVLERLGLQIPVCGMVKDDRHRTRGLYFHDAEIPIDVHTEAFHLITRIQDEAHRFAIEYHKNLRSKEQIHSVLEDIPGVGEKRRRALMRSFGDIDAMKHATLKEIAALPEFNLPAAKLVYAFFHDGEIPEEDAVATAEQSAKASERQDAVAAKEQPVEVLKEQSAKVPEGGRSC